LRGWLPKLAFRFYYGRNEVRDTGETWDGLPVYILDEDTNVFRIQNIGTKEQPKAALVVGMNLSKNYKTEFSESIHPLG
jgi:hypothetical protein